MANNNIIYTAADYNITLTKGTKVLNSATAILESVDFNAKLESENVYSIGSKYPQGLKTNGYAYGGKLSLEAGEVEKFLVLLGKNGDELIYPDMTGIDGCTIAIMTTSGNLDKVFNDVVITSHDLSVKAKDKRSLVSFNWEALSISSKSKQQ